jgi:hypothetical protein
MAMGAALHLAHAHQIPPGPKRKRKGGGGGGSAFHEYATRIYADERADAHARELLLALAYAVTTAPAGDGSAQWDLVRKALGTRRTRRAGMAELILEDVPGYISPLHDRRWESRYCEAPRLRPYRSRPYPGATPQQVAELAKADEADFRNTDNVCGDVGQEYVVEKLPATGWHKVHYFCPRHRDHQLRVKAQVAEGNKLAPEPIPNKGGLLPSYFNAEWLKVYQHYRGPNHKGDLWQPPVYGIRADDWPIPGKEPVPMRARLRLAALDGELLTGGAS